MTKSKFEDYAREGVGAVITNTSTLLSGKRCVIQHFDSRVNKYKVIVEGSINNLIAWYTLEELRLDGVGEKK